jgi:hypothetical protein
MLHRVLPSSGCMTDAAESYVVSVHLYQTTQYFVKNPWWLWENVKQSRYRPEQAQSVDRGEWSASRPGRFTPGKDPVPTVQEDGWAPGPVWTYAKNFVPIGIFLISNSIPVASRYTDWATWSEIIVSMKWNCTEVTYTTDNRRGPFQVSIHAIKRKFIMNLAHASTSIHLVHVTNFASTLKKNYTYCLHHNCHITKHNTYYIG